MGSSTTAFFGKISSALGSISTIVLEASMGVVIGVLVLLISIALVVLLALSEWYDFEPAGAAHQAAAAALPALAGAPAKSARRGAAKAKPKAAKPARRAAKRRA
jgi:hypothetical protein